jgi:hypothetical protein
MTVIGFCVIVNEPGVCERYVAFPDKYVTPSVAEVCVGPVHEMIYVPAFLGADGE